MTHVHKLHTPHRASTRSQGYHAGYAHLPFPSTSVTPQQSQTVHHTAIAFPLSSRVTHTSHSSLKLFSLSSREASKDKQILLKYFFAHTVNYLGKFSTREGPQKPSGELDVHFIRHTRVTLT